MTTNINYIKDNIVEVRTTEPQYIEQMKEQADELRNDDTILQFEERDGEIRMLIQIDEPQGDSSFLDRLRYIH